MGVGKRIKRLLAINGMSIKELSEQSGVSINTLYTITKRDSETVRQDTLNKLATALGVPKDFLIADGKIDVFAGVSRASDNEDEDQISIENDIRKFLNNGAGFISAEEVTRYLGVDQETAFSFLSGVAHLDYGKQHMFFIPDIAAKIVRSKNSK